MISFETMMEKINNGDKVKFPDINVMLSRNDIDEQSRLKIIDFVLTDKRIDSLFRKKILSSKEREYVIKNGTLTNKNLFLALNKLLMNAELTKEEAVMFCKHEIKLNRPKSNLRIYMYFNKLIDDNKIDDLKYFVININHYETVAFFFSSLMYFFQRNHAWDRSAEYYDKVCEQFKIEGLDSSVVSKSELDRCYLNVLFWYAINKYSIGQSVGYNWESANNCHEIRKCVYDAYKDEIVKYALKSQNRSIECLKFYSAFLNEESKQKLIEQILKSKKDIGHFQYVISNKNFNIADFYERIIKHYSEWLVVIPDEQIDIVNAKYLLSTLIK